MTDLPSEAQALLRRYDPPVRALALGLRKVVLFELGRCHEYVFAMRSAVVFLYGSTERVIDDGVCSINVFRRHVNLGLSHGVDLDDERGLLRGTGKRMRHLQLKQLSDLDSPGLRAYLQNARAHAGIKRPRKPTPEDVVTRVKT
jgi:hypothetical protein